ncbi:LacI family DNA-binding transcriptional regulator [Paramicrobacterium chengjingii]|uniref:LacI family DNA-binding transcriptional regulator n=1 Tax=Paramicrobacterium chengjingii TaxID=2769067 RepID=A0ABX6YKJ8_9MICO|nr:LacI family DNA-binding transcriptional regulator [Microbacterium chengjingii]QPZ39354.1 LacI family DNA-binding transcriptional regulator [Microbacterium chengjingii]
MDETAKDERPTNRQPSIKDVAAKAGVSWRTVSNVIHGHRYLRPETKEKVESAIAELGYRPRVAARQLRGGKSNLLTLAVPYISHPYFARLAHAVVEAAGREKYDVLIDETHGRIEREKRVARGYGSILTDGIIFSPLSMTVEEIVENRDSTPLVLLGEHLLNPHIDHVILDNVTSTQEATEHVISSGRRRIGFLGYLALGTLGTADLRFEGYKKALDAAGIPFDPGLVVGAAHSDPEDASFGPEGDYSREEGFARAESLIGRIGDFDAIICANDLLAIGLLHAFRLHDVRVPEDVMVLGWDNAPEGAFTAPSLTTVSPDLDSVATYAVEALLRRIDDPAAEPSGQVAPHELVLRESTEGIEHR